MLLGLRLWPRRIPGGLGLRVWKKNLKSEHLRGRVSSWV